MCVCVGGVGAGRRAALAHARWLAGWPACPSLLLTGSVHLPPTAWCAGRRRRRRRSRCWRCRATTPSQQLPPSPPRPPAAVAALPFFSFFHFIRRSRAATRITCRARGGFALLPPPAAAPPRLLSLQGSLSRSRPRIACVPCTSPCLVCALLRFLFPSPPPPPSLSPRRAPRAPCAHLARFAFTPSPCTAPVLAPHPLPFPLLKTLPSPHTMNSQCQAPHHQVAAAVQGGGGGAPTAVSGAMHHTLKWRVPLPLHASTLRAPCLSQHAGAGMGPAGAAGGGGGRCGAAAAMRALAHLAAARGRRPRRP